MKLPPFIRGVNASNEEITLEVAGMTRAEKTRFVEAAKASPFKKVELWATDELNREATKSEAEPPISEQEP